MKKKLVKRDEAVVETGRLPVCRSGLYEVQVNPTRSTQARGKMHGVSDPREDIMQEHC